ncbi:hypothetical protein SEA_TARSUSIV_70 [Mycobacterium phage TarsusIV]|nr:hypothetical protein SEA_TARSUSIV_70 [Mycobacterium phage TarsusIV]
MKEYRTTLDLDPETSYTYVEMGPKPEMPYWHESAQPSRFPFPKEQAAFRFAEAHREPGRKVQVITPDGKRFDI